ncbi:MAG: diaminopimelate epimerase, partial [Acetobacteraceae bacterium]
MALGFVKMHGCGNDFVVLYARPAPLELTSARAAALADRRRGIGCDQIILIEPPPAGSDADAALRFLNADGSEAGACGNGTRCAAALLAAESGRSQLRLRTIAGNLACTVLAPDRVSVDMGEARLGWQDIPLARPADTLHLDLARGPLADPAAAGMGNPHATFFVADADSIPLETLGPQFEHDPWFPERANIGVAEVRAHDRIRLRVWERGAGLTLACGSG